MDQPQAGGSKKVKICVFGAGGVGKSAMSIKFIQGKFVEKYDPTIEDTFKKQKEVDGEVAIMEITDTAGQEEYKALRATCYQKAEGFLAVYSVADRSSYSEVLSLRDDVLAERNCGSCPMVLCGNKCDISDGIRKVTKQEGEDLARSWFSGEAQPAVPFFETSAKDEVNIEEAFHQLVREVRRSKGCIVKPQPVPEAKPAAEGGEATAKHVDPRAQVDAAPVAAAPTEAAPTAEIKKPEPKKPGPEAPKPGPTKVVEKKEAGPEKRKDEISAIRADQAGWRKKNPGLPEFITKERQERDRKKKKERDRKKKKERKKKSVCVLQ